MPKENLIDGNVDLKTWQGYVASMLENIKEDIRNNKEEAVESIRQVHESIEKISDKFDELNIEAVKHSNCGIDDLKIVVHGDGKNGGGLINKVNRIATELKIKSGIWGIMGGMIPVLIMIIIAFAKMFHSS